MKVRRLGIGEAPRPTPRKIGQLLHAAWRLRHTFAVHRLLRWYREGADVQGRLQSLSVFLGHVNVYSTQVYLSATGDLLHAANDRFHRHVAPAINTGARP